MTKDFKMAKVKDLMRVFVCLVSHVRLFGTLWPVARQAHPSVELFRQEYWRGFSFSPSGTLSGQGLRSPVSPALQMNSLPIEPSGKP